MRLTHDEYFLVLAKVASLRSTCKSRQVGAVLVDWNKHVLATGYNGPAQGTKHCEPCKRLGQASGDHLDDCMAVHAEQNALLQCKDTKQIHTIYLTNSPCLTCLKMLLNTSCDRIVFLDFYSSEYSQQLWVASGRIWDGILYDLTDMTRLETATKGLFNVRK